MGFFDRKVNDSFDAIFDLDRDGNLDIFEQLRKSEYLENELKKNNEDEFEDEFDDELDDESDDDLDDESDDDFDDELDEEFDD